MEYFNKINFFVGVNGAGKSRYLNKIAEYYNSQDCNILEISNTVFDRFYFSSRKIKKLVIENDKNFLVLSLLSIFENIEKNNMDDGLYKQLNFISRSFDYVGYHSQIKVKFFIKDKNGKLNKEINLLDLDLNELVYEAKLKNKNFKGANFLYEDLSEIRYIIKKLVQNDNSLIVDFDSSYYFNNDLRLLYRVFNYFKSLSFIGFNFFVKKNNYSIPVENISSGELHLLLNTIFLASNIDFNRRNIVLVDEPEVSLHPKWQREYVERLIGNFEYYDFKFFFATHSPLVISRLQYQERKILDKSYKIFKVNNSEIFPVLEDDDYSIESMYWEVFEILTPHSSFLSRYTVRLFEMYEKNQITHSYVINELDKLIHNATTDKQHELLEIIKTQFIKLNGA